MPPAIDFFLVAPPLSGPALVFFVCTMTTLLLLPSFLEPRRRFSEGAIDMPRLLSSLLRPQVERFGVLWKMTVYI